MRREITIKSPRRPWRAALLSKVDNFHLQYPLHWLIYLFQLPVDFSVAPEKSLSRD